MSPILEISKISKSFGGLNILHEIDLQVRPGEILGLIGPNGAGKTTLFNILSGGLKPDSGTVRAFGTLIQKKKPYEIAQMGIARTFQVSRPFLKMTCAENVRIGLLSKKSHKVEKEKTITGLLEKLGLAEHFNTEARLLTLMEKKKLEIARALSLFPKVLLLDEVMSGLNPTEMNEAMALLKTLQKDEKITVVWIEHVMKAVMGTADRIAVLHQGHLLRIGTPLEVASDKKVIEVYLGGASHA